MRVYLVIDETPFFHPEMVCDLITGLSGEDQLVGASVVEEIPSKSNINRYILRNIHRMKVRELALLGYRKLRSKVLDMIYPEGRAGKFFSVKSALSFYDIPTVPVRRTINNETVLEPIKAANPDIVISSNSLIFGKRLLDLPAIGCINRHSALLPAYGGILPVFQAVARGETETGVSVHTMTAGIDEGDVLAQRTVPIDENSTLWTLYQKCFQQSAPAILDAIEVLRSETPSKIGIPKKPSYYSFPTAEDWERFRSQRGRWI